MGGVTPLMWQKNFTAAGGIFASSRIAASAAFARSRRTTPAANSGKSSKYYLSQISSFEVEPGMQSKTLKHHLLYGDRFVR